MTIDEAIDILQMAQAEIEWNYPLDYQVAFDMAVKALKDRKGRRIKFDEFMDWLDEQATFCETQMLKAVKRHDYAEAERLRNDKQTYEFIRLISESNDELEVAEFVEVAE